MKATLPPNYIARALIGWVFDVDDSDVYNECVTSLSICHLVLTDLRNTVFLAWYLRKRLGPASLFRANCRPIHLNEISKRIVSLHYGIPVFNLFESVSQIESFVSAKK